MWHNFIHANICSIGDPEGGKRGEDKKYLKTKWLKKFKTGENYETTVSRNSTKPKHKKYEENYTSHHNQIVPN